MAQQYITSRISSPIGELTLALKDGKVAGLWIAGQKYFGQSVAGTDAPRSAPPEAEPVRRWLELYFAGKRPDPATLELAPEGSEFRRAVWRALLGIPYGDTRSYGRLAREVERATGRKTSPRAVGGAVGHNPISIIIPCHRVVGANGRLTGYAAGLEVKQALLALERDSVQAIAIQK